MTEIVRYATERWPDWFGTDGARSVEQIVMAGGRAARRRAIVFLMSTTESRPAVAIKIAFTPREEDFLEAEFAALSDLRPSLPPGLRATVPEALGLDRVGGHLMLFTHVLEGRRLLVPHLTRRASLVSKRLIRAFLARSFSWSNELAQTTGQAEQADEAELQDVIDRFLALYPIGGGAQRDIRAFARALGRERIRWSPSWQHRDVAVGNVLNHKGTLRVLDWEHASARTEPWFDIAYAPGALTLLAQQQDAFHSVRHAALAVLGRDAWAGGVLRGEMERVWHHPLPLSWAVALVVMNTAVRSRGHGRNGWASWGELAMCLLADRELRQTAGWLVPEW
jgi:hypothetical protein